MKREFVILVLIDIVDSVKWIERLGDVKSTQQMKVYNRIFRGLLIKYQGVEIDKTDGALLIFERMRDALRYIDEYHRLVEHHLKLRSRVGVHCGEVIMHTNHDLFVSRGAKLIEVDGLQKSIAARIMSVASAGQTLLSGPAGEYASAVRGDQVLRDLGKFKLKGVYKLMNLWAISSSAKRLKRPKNTDKVKYVRAPKLTPEQQVQRFWRSTLYPYLGLLLLRELMMIMSMIELMGACPRLYLMEMSRAISVIVSFIHGLFYF